MNATIAPIGVFAHITGWGTPPGSSYAGSVAPIGIFAHIAGWNNDSGAVAPSAAHKTGFHINLGSMMIRR